jgi:hypothetical protein
VVSKQITLPPSDRVKLLIKPRGKTARLLARTGKAKVKIKVIFQPNGGDPITATRTIRLVKQTPHR